MNLFKWFKRHSGKLAPRKNSTHPQASDVPKNASQPTAEVTEAQVYELDGMLLLPDKCWTLTPSDLTSQSKVALERESSQGSFEEILHPAESYKLVYGFNGGHLDAVQVNAKYLTSFLGVSSGQPEHVLSQFGYRVIVTMPGGSTFSYLPSTPNHYIAVNRHDSPRFVELYYQARTIDSAFLANLRDKQGGNEPDDPGAKLEQEVGQLILQLVRIGNTCGYEAKEEETRRIGEKLNDIGGFTLMQRACYQVISVIGAQAGTEIERKWDGIGKWSS